MQIRRLNPVENPRDLAGIAPAFRRWQRDYLPDLPAFGEVRLRHWCTSGFEQQALVFGAFADDDAVEADGFATFGFELKTNLDLTWANIFVPADKRTGGAETALFEELVRQTEELGRKRLAVEMPRTQAPAPFADLSGGGNHTDTAVMSTLDLGTIDQAQYAQWAEPSAKNSEYTLVGWIERCPDELAESYCRAMDAMADQPIGSFEYEFAKVPIERLRFGEALMAKLGIRRYVQAALDREGNVAGFNVLAAYPDEPEYMEVWNTGVPRGHRGHGLGLRVKAAATLWVLEDRPSTRLVGTFNNDENQWMLAVNRTMDYRPLVEWPGYEFTVSA